MTEKEKYRQVRKEAGWTGLALLALIVFWLLAGFGMAQVEARFLHLPLWVWTSSIGVWFMAILLVKLLVGKVFKDMDLEDEEKGGASHE